MHADQSDSVKGYLTNVFQNVDMARKQVHDMHDADPKFNMLSQKQNELIMSTTFQNSN